MKFKQFLDEAIRIDTGSYEASHGGKPGSAKAIKELGEPGPSSPWYFEIGGEKKLFKGDWNSAKKQASSYARKKGEQSVKVLP